MIRRAFFFYEVFILAYHSLCLTLDNHRSKLMSQHSKLQPTSVIVAIELFRFLR